MRRRPNVGSLLGQRRRRRANSEPTLGQRLVYEVVPPLVHYKYQDEVSLSSHHLVSPPGTQTVS